MWRVDKSWIEIEDDFKCEQPTIVNVQSCDYQNKYDKDLVIRFRMYDDDGILYYEGRADEDTSFEPLDDFGMPNAGCTYIKYWNDDEQKWETV